MFSETDMILAVDMLGDRKAAGWQFSEKKNGVRLEWDGEIFWTRSGNAIEAPKWFTRGLPRLRINFELHGDRGTGTGNGNSGFNAARCAVRFGGHWWDDPQLRLAALYVSEHSGNWFVRQRAAAKAVKGCRFAEAIPTGIVRDGRHLAEIAIHYRRLNAEGLMFLDPHGTGACGRTGELLRLKYEHQKN